MRPRWRGCMARRRTFPSPAPRRGMARASVAGVAEVPVAFPNDEVSAEEVAARLRAAGVAARVDRGLHGSWQLPAQGQMTVLVNAKDAARSHKVLGTTAREEAAPGPLTRVVVAVLIGALVFGLIAIAAVLVSR